MKLAVVIVNYRTAAMVEDCLASLAGELPAGTQVIVVDNASGDASSAQIASAIRQRGWQGWARLQALDVNGGFAAGNNAALGALLLDMPEFILLLNPDTLVKPGAIAALLDFMAAHPQAGIVGSRLEGLDGSLQRAARRFPSILGEFEFTARTGPITRLLATSVIAPPDPDSAQQCDWIPGASMLIRRAVFEQIGLLDEGYFMYYEEVDFCYRAKEARWQVWYLPASRVVHLVGQSSGVTSAGSSARLPRRPRYWFVARQRFFTKHRGLGYRCLADLAWLAGMGVHGLRRIVQRRPSEDPPYLVRDFIRYAFGRPVRPS